MKCTNRSVAVLLAALLGAGWLCGCGLGREKITAAYDMDSTVANFNLLDGEGAERLTGFAKDLCVASEDVNTSDPAVDGSLSVSAGLFDLNAKEVLYANNIHEKLPPASLTKVMTALVALKYGNLSDTITAGSDVMITEPGAQLCGLKAGDTLTMEQALYALLVNSANDAAVAIADHVGGSVQGFCEMMNEEAMAIGATNCHFVNPHGLTAEDHYVTAYDMYLIFNEAVKYEDFVKIINTPSYKSTYYDSSGAGKKLEFMNSNQYLNGNSDAPAQITVVGGKTGSTKAAGKCLILYSKDASDNPYISVILNAQGSDGLYEEMTQLLQKITSSN